MPFCKGGHKRAAYDSIAHAFYCSTLLELYIYWSATPNLHTFPFPFFLFFSLYRPVSCIPPAAPLLEEVNSECTIVDNVEGKKKSYKIVTWACVTFAL